MAHIDIPAGEAPESHRLLQVQADMGTAMGVLADAIYNKSGLDKRVREAVRMRIAILNQCQVCLDYRFDECLSLGIDEGFYAAVDNWRNSSVFNEKERLALEYSELFASDHLAIDAAFFSRLKQHFSDVEIYELTTTIAGLIANGRILKVLDVEQVCSL